MEEIRRMQTELDRRTEIENQAIDLMRECRYEEANELLAELEEKANGQDMEEQRKESN